jgi:type IV secretory pathway TraG/TraD family ATPase VirD4
MNSVIFQRPNSDERSRALFDLLAQTDASAVVFTPSAATLADSPQPESRNGHKVIKLLFGLDTGDSFDPLDVVRQIQVPREEAIGTLLEPFVHAISENHSILRHLMEPACRILAASLLEKVVLDEVSRKPDISLPVAVESFYNDDVIKNFATLLKSEERSMALTTHAVIAAFLQQSDPERSVILSHIQAATACLMDGSVRRVVERTSFDLGLLAGGAATVYVEVPPGRRAHALVARVWLAALLQLVAAGTGRGRPVLFVVDGAAGLEAFPQLLAAQRLPAGAAEVWSFWESLGQLRERHPADWSAFLGGCQAVQVLGPLSPPVAAELAGVFAVPADELARLAPGRRLALWGPQPESGLRPAEAAAPVSGGHVATFAPAHADRWLAVAAALRARSERTAVILESAGHCHALTAQERAATGPVVCLDPFSVLGGEGDQFNPLDILKSGGPQPAADALQFAGMLHSVMPWTHQYSSYWWIKTFSLLSGMLGYLPSVPGQECNLIELRRILDLREITATLGHILETRGKQIPSESRQIITAFLANNDNERTCLVLEAFYDLRIFSDPQVAAAVQKTSFDLAAFARGAPMTLYIELPILRLPSHGLLLRLWFASLLSLRSANLSAPTPLWIIDSPFSSYLFPVLHTAQGGSLADVWTFWESLGQLREGQPAEWSAFLANTHTVEALGPQNPVVAAELAAAFGHPREVLQSLTPRQRLRLNGSPSGKEVP